MKIKASSPITSWQINGETMQTVADFIFLGSKITAYGDCSHKIKRHLHVEREVMTNLDSILKSRDITLLTKVHLVKAMAFSVVMYGYDIWTIYKHGIFLAGILEWVAISFSRGPSQPRDQTCISCVSCIAGEFFTH